MPMAASSITPNSSTRLKPETPSSHLSSKLVDLGFHSKSISLKKKKPAIQCAIDFPFPKQPYQKPLIPKDTPKKPQPPHWNPLQGALATAIDTLEHALLSLELQHPLPKTIDPRVQLAGNFAPVPEHPVRHSLPVTGTIPECINGVYLRNGPNPFFHPVAGHHFFDGDGMVHAVAITGGAASYACRFTETQKLVQERKLNRPLFPKPIGELHGGAGLVRLVALLLRRAFGIVDGGTGTSNTGLVFFDGRVLAMSEDDLPYELRVTPSGDLRKVGRYTFGNQLNSSMIAHPKIDPESGELFALSYDILRPKIRYFRFSPEGKKSQEVDVTLPAPTMVHDFAITENFVVVPDQQVVFKVEEMVKSRSPLMFDQTKKPRFGILPKYTENENDIVWVESPDDTFCFHLWNAWEERETNEVVVIASRMNSPGSIFMDNDDNGDERFKSVLCEIRLNLETRESTRRPIVLEEEHVNLEMGMVSRHVLGRKTRYAYLAIADPWPKVSGFAKVDMVTGEVRKHYHGDGRFGGEPFFLARGKHGDGDGDEDDGYVMVLVHDEGNCMSELQIVNAVDLEVEATVMLPSRVPYGFHGIFVDAKDLAKQPCH